MAHEKWRINYVLITFVRLVRGAETSVAMGKSRERREKLVNGEKFSLWKNVGCGLYG